VTFVYYGLTAQAPPDVKHRFLEQLQVTLDNVPHNDTLVMLGDFNARVGCHMIDFVVMRNSQKNCSLDVQAMRGANCWTDHYMVRGRLRMMFPLPANVKKHSLPLLCTS